MKRISSITRQYDLLMHSHVVDTHSYTCLVTIKNISYLFHDQKMRFVILNLVKVQKSSKIISFTQLTKFSMDTL